MVHRSDSELNFDFIVFEGRNHDYGAFDNRQRYNTRLKHSLMIVFLFSIAVLTTQIIFTEFFEKNFIKPLPPREVSHEIVTDIPMIEKPMEKPKSANTEVVPTKSNSKNYVINDKAVEVNPDPDPKPDDGTEVSTVENSGTGKAGVSDTSSYSEAGGTNDAEVVPDDKTYDYTDEMPEFPGGNEGLNKYFTRNIVFPDDAIRDGVSGKVSVSFIIGKDGAIRDVKLVRGIDRRCDEEAVRVVSRMPKWKPGKAKGKLVSVKKVVPIVFKNDLR